MHHHGYIDVLTVLAPVPPVFVPCPLFAPFSACPVNHALVPCSIIELAVSWALWSALREGTDYLLPQTQEDGAGAGGPFMGGSAFGAMPGMPPMAHTMDRGGQAQQQQQQHPAAFATAGHRLGSDTKSTAAGGSCCAGRDRGDDAPATRSSTAGAGAPAAAAAQSPTVASDAQRAQDRDARAKAAMARLEKGGGNGTITITKS